MTLGVRCHDDLLEKIDEFRRAEPDKPTRAEAVRRLTVLGLGTRKGRR
jgi:hypothetical protein